MMHMTFYWSTNVTLLFSSWQTDTWLTYSLTLFACFLFSVFYQYMEDRRLRFKLQSSSSTANGGVDGTPLLAGKKVSSRVGKIAGSVMFGVNSAIGYFLMLAVMSFNGAYEHNNNLVVGPQALDLHLGFDQSQVFNHYVKFLN
ncbi:copper transporter 5.1 [Artemisia annua]|uniref:Copper transport protein n=1 Tax=Artemisia annua TaxID=35608 RepID=A0A2U1N0P3_ARTAN|nr:copper transporter 5.1 [Artemisia annua]